MTLHYRCRNCDHIFDEYSCAYVPGGYEPYEFWGERGMRKLAYPACPHCECEDLSEYQFSEEPDDEEETHDTATTEQ